MNKLSIILLVAAASLGMACTKQEATPTDAAKAASHQNQYEATHFVNASDIELDDREIKFDHNFNFTEIDDKK